MTFNYTDEQLNRLNQGSAVYSVNKNFSDRNKKKFVTTNPTSDNATNTIDVSGQQFKVIKTLSDPGTGFDGMAVAPVVNGEPDLKNVAVVAAGTESGNLVDLAGAAGTRFATLSLQYKVADGFLQDVMDMPDVRVTQLTGYSQGSYVLKSGAKYHIPTTVFNGWFDYNALSDEEKQYMQAFPHLFRNYRKKSDNVVSLLDGNEPRKHYKHFDDYGTIT